MPIPHKITPKSQEKGRLEMLKGLRIFDKFRRVA